MSSKKNSSARNVSFLKKRRTITMATKLDIIKRSEKGETPASIGRALDIPRTSVVTIIKDKVRIKKYANGFASMQATVITKQRAGLIAEVEKLLMVWLDQTQRCAPISLAVIQEKARSLYEFLKQERGESSNTKPFTASRGWFARFKARANLNNFKMTGEIVSTDKEAALTFPKTLAKIIEENGYCARQVFNVDETGLYWKKMPSKTYIAKEESSLLGYKASKDRLTLLLGANAAGDCKIKPLLVYHLENPSALEGCSKESLPVIWKSNPKAWITGIIFKDWFIHHFVPAIKDYCHDNNLAFKALLILDSAPCHSVHLDDLYPNIKVVCLPPNTTSLLQPMDQGIINSFKACYLRQTFAQAIRITDVEDGPTLKEFWKSFSIYHAMINIGYSWNEMKQSSLNSVWRKLCPDFVSDDQGIIETVADVVENIVEMGKELNLEVTQDDVDELLASHSEELSKEDLLQLKQQKFDEFESQCVEDTPPCKVLTTKVLFEAFKHLETAMALFEKNDPNNVRSAYVNQGIHNMYSCYREIYKRRKAAIQNSLDIFFKRSGKSASKLSAKHSANSSDSNDSDIPDGSPSRMQIFQPAELL